MGESGRARLLPWGSVLTIVVLTAVLVWAFPINPTPTSLPAAQRQAWANYVQAVFPEAPDTAWLPPLNLAAALITVGSVFLIERRLQRYLWAVAAALLLIWHPLFQLQFVQAANPALMAEALLFAALACTFLAWDLTFLPAFALRGWLVTAVGLTLCVGLAWVAQPTTGLRTALLAGGGLWLAYALTRRLRRRASQPPLSAWNLRAAVTVGTLAPVGGFLLVPRLIRMFAWLGVAVPTPSTDLLAQLRAALPTLPTAAWREFSTSYLAQWCWPSVWLAVPVLAWALWRTLRRGWKQWRQNQPPLPWLLALFAVFILFSAPVLPAGEDSAALLARTALATLLFVFWVADLFRGMVERLVLRPPEDDRGTLREKLTAGEKVTG